MIYKLNPAIQAVKTTTGAFDVEYTLVHTNNKTFRQKKVEIIEMPNGPLKGVKAKVILEEVDGVEQTFTGRFTIPAGSSFVGKGTFLSISIFTDNNGMLKEEGNGILDGDGAIED